MISIKVEFVGTLLGRVGKRKREVILDKPSTILALIQKLEEDFNLNENIFLQKETVDFKPNILILVNGKEINVLKGLDTILEDKASVTFIPITHGG